MTYYILINVFVANIFFHLSTLLSFSWLIAALFLGHGQVFLMDPWWNPAVERQAQDRIHRIGQYKPIRF